MANHVLICGMTASGKSYAAKWLARRALARGKKVLVYNPFKDNFPATKEFSDIFEFLNFAKAARNCLLIIDEAAAAIGSGTGERAPLIWFATMSRHCGHQSIFITQRLTGICPQIRDNCKTLFLFAVHKNSAELAADAFNDDELLNAPRLPKYHFFKKSFFEPAKICKI